MTVTIGAASPFSPDTTAPAKTVSKAPMRIAGRGRVDPNTAVRFTFDGRTIEALTGDTVASALLAHDIHLVGRSFKYHRPRGIVTAGSEEPNALIGIRRGDGREEPNTRATLQEVYEGLETVSQNRWPSLRFDVGAVNDRLARLIPAGFYYKTFMWPRSFWRTVYEPLIRRAAGLGTAPTAPDPDRYAARYHHTDVLVVGAGPAGLAAALAAARSGATVTLCEETAELGGSLLLSPQLKIDGKEPAAFLAETNATLAQSGVKTLCRTTAIGYDHQNMVNLVERVSDHLASPPNGAPRERLWRVRAKHVVLAQGALERPLLFDGNDRPGVMLAGAALTYLHRYGVAVGRRPCVVTCHDSAYRTAFDLHDAGMTVGALVDGRGAISPSLMKGAAERGIRVIPGARPLATGGRLRVRALTVESDMGRETLPCDTLLMSGGWTPSVHLFSHTKGALTFQDGAFLPKTTGEACEVAGASRGLWGVGTALDDGDRAGVAAASAVGLTVSPHAYSLHGEREETGHSGQPIGQGRKVFTDFQNDVTQKDIRLAVREGMRSVEHVKRYTTNGMATDQGKLSNINALQVAADALGMSPPEVGLTTFRPPYTPTTFGTIANYRRGAGFEVTRKTPIDAWAEEEGAVFEPVSLWRRARYFPRAGETMAAALSRECRTTRRAVGIFDASTLGKIEVVGPDAAEFLNRLYTNPLLKLAPGRCRYCLLLGEDGFIRDDGIVARLGEDRFHVTTTTGGASHVLSKMEDYLQTEWPDLKVWLTSTTEEYVAIALNGPDARRTLKPLVEGLDLSPQSFPHMSVASCQVAGVPARLFRVSFTGEVGFEINVPARSGLKVWHALLQAGAPYGITPYGTEAMHLMRAEKGYIIVGQDTDGTMTPEDMGLAWAIGRKKADFVGLRGLMRPDLVKEGRRQFVGLLTEDPGTVLEEGAQVVADPLKPLPLPMIGHVTSAYFSDAVGRSIALAVIENGCSRLGETIYLPMADAFHAATIVAPAFYDPAGERLNG